MQLECYRRIPDFQTLRFLVHVNPMRKVFFSDRAWSCSKTLAMISTNQKFRSVEALSPTSKIWVVSISRKCSHSSHSSHSVELSAADQSESLGRRETTAARRLKRTNHHRRCRVFREYTRAVKYRLVKLS